MSNEVRNQFYTAVPMTVTNLHSLADGSLWHSGVIATAPLANVQYPNLKIFYNLVLVTPAQSDTIKFYFAEADEAASGEIWAGNISESEGAVATAASVATFTDNVPVLKTVTLSNASPETTQKGVIEVTNPAPNWQLGILCGGVAIAASGSNLTYRYYEPQGQ